MEELWIEVRKLPKILIQIDFKKGRRNYFGKVKTEAKLIFMNLGELNLRSYRRREATAKHGFLAIRPDLLQCGLQCGLRMVIANTYGTYTSRGCDDDRLR